MRDNEFLRNKVPMTKSEVRAISIDKLKLQDKKSMLDIGSGTGSVSIQAAIEDPKLQVTAIEHNPDGIDIMNQNIEKFNIHNINLIEGEAPDDLPDDEYDAIFIGGSGGNQAEIIDYSIKHLKVGGTLVLNFILFENAQSAVDLIATQPLENVEVIQAAISKWHSLGKGHYFKPQNPTIIISATRKG
ncbi:decarboxylating cobalt-precorrin-6B (C(15))-methyltransferase [Lentilactobacillus kosonis]|uniref:Cobalt-precorrin-6y C15-methyltransferase n=1 Tax=Lentilactobacillus kosonis TaxID=2810561 RepID=A0A401FMV2_9LACO|nr:decarboxylating cobalt-precorrin-6B (C(15))-methyltransferase [Lentilactobacillus kosonis]GAY73663.1 cobalt-precorrin-6y C15-methyltransferase [Lentilactobacillus kosonis]